MNIIDRIIRESLLESYIYLESCGQVMLPDRDTLNRKILKSKALRRWFQYDGIREKGFSWQEIDRAYDMEPKKELYLMNLDIYLKAVLMHELQINRAE